VIVAFIDEHKDRFGVEPICAVLSEHGAPIAPSTYYDARHRPPSKRQLRDAELVKLIQAERATKFGRLLGARKTWLRLRGQGHEVARCTVERLFRELGITGVTRAKSPRTTVPDDKAQRPQDLVDRQFVANRPNQLWVADFTYVPTWEGMVYVAFIIDVFSRRIIGWRAATSMTTPLVLDALEMAIWARRKGRHHRPVRGLVHHTDAGSQGEFQRSSQHLDRGGVWWRVRGSLGRSDRWVRGGSGGRIGHCGPRCVRRVGPSRRGRSSVRSGG
jgi:putative transposase